MNESAIFREKNTQNLELQIKKKNVMLFVDVLIQQQ